MNFKMIRKLFVAILPLIVIASSGHSRAEPAVSLGGPSRDTELASQLSFDALSEAQKKVLAPMREQWADLPAAQQQRLSRGAKRWADMSEEQQTKARAKMQRWLSMSPDKRQKLLERLERYQAMSPQQRQRLRKTFRKFRQLPKEQREFLRERWRRSGPAERRKMREELMNQREVESSMGESTALE